MSRSKLKSECFKCKVMKWVTDFKEGRYSMISSTSVCLSCEQAAKIEAQKKEIDRLKAREQEKDDRIKRLEEQLCRIEKLIPKEGGKGVAAKSGETSYNLADKVKELSKAVKENRDDIVETGRQVVEVREQIASSKDTANFKTVKGKKSTNISDKEQHINLTNRYAALVDEVDDTEIETYVIGDSIVREQTHHFAKKNTQKRKIQSYSGCKAKKVIDEVKALKIRKKNTCIIANAGGNDLFLRGDHVGRTEPLIKDLTCLVDAVANKTDRGILMGIMPRVYASYFAMSKAIGINERIKKYCIQKKVEFIDVWDSFVGKRQFFRRDGIHLNEVGHRRLEEILTWEYEREKSKENMSPKTSELLLTENY